MNVQYVVVNIKICFQIFRYFNKITPLVPLLCNLIPSLYMLWHKKTVVQVV